MSISRKLAWIVLLLGGQQLALAQSAETEAVDGETADDVAEYADILQVGARNMQNYPLLRKVGKIGKPILLKRGLSATMRSSFSRPSLKPGEQ